MDDLFSSVSSESSQEEINCVQIFPDFLNFCELNVEESNKNFLGCKADPPLISSIDIHNLLQENKKIKVSHK